ncbi:MAG: alpha mannosidase-like protein [Watsoniomyces obsoletus]|nr:MAG: alpha mannosidase-like protein [Watsoniomyces obsoletus]
MLLPQRRRWWFLGACLMMTSFLLFFSAPVGRLSSTYSNDWQASDGIPAKYSLPGLTPVKPTFDWATFKQLHPVPSMIPLPTGRPPALPRIQKTRRDRREDEAAKAVREKRLAAVKEAFQHAWSSYKSHAWMKDELAPISGGSRNTFGGWSATLVDALDTLWIMGFHVDFKDAVRAVASIDFNTTEETNLNIFETTIRYLGGLLGAYDVSGGRYPILLEKATELGNMLYAAFDTPNRMPVTRWDWRPAAQGKNQEASEWVLVSELTSLSLEFTRLSQLTKDPKYFDAIQRITDELDRAQNHTKLPGMWPVVVDAKRTSFGGDNSFTLGGMSDSLYEYLLKEHLLLGGQLDGQYGKLYEGSLRAIKEHLLFRPMTEDGADILFSGNARVDGPNKIELEPKVQHLGCFAGGMVGMGSKIFNSPQDLEIARKLVDGCIWAYEHTPSGLMPEIFHAVPCAADSCPWAPLKWHAAVTETKKNKKDASKPDTQSVEEKIKSDRLFPGASAVDDRRYILRPEAIESVFVLFRITDDVKYLDKAWSMFETIQKHTRTDLANAAIDDVTLLPPPKADRMESFWLAETLKYFYLIFSDPSVVNLDDFVLNTEAHPLRRPQ